MTNTAYKTRKLLSMLSCAEKENDGLMLTHTLQNMQRNGKQTGCYGHTMKKKTKKEHYHEQNHLYLLQNLSCPVCSLHLPEHQCFGTVLHAAQYRAARGQCHLPEQMLRDDACGKS